MPVHVLLIGDDDESHARIAAELTAAGHSCEVSPPSDSVSLLSSKRFPLILVEEDAAAREALVYDLRLAAGVESVIVAMAPGQRGESLIRAGADSILEPGVVTFAATATAAEQLFRSRHDGPPSLIQAVAMMATSLAAGFEDPDAIRRALIPLAEAASIDRILAMDHTPGEGTWGHHFTWVRGGYMPPGGLPFVFDIAAWGFEAWTREITAGRPVDVRASEVTGLTRRVFDERANGTGAMFIVPAGWDGGRWTTVVFADVDEERHWTDEEKDALTAAAVALEGALRWRSYRGQLEESEARLSSFLENIPDVILIVGRDGTYLDRVAGGSVELRFAIVGRNLRDALAEEAANERLRLIDEVLATGEMRIHDYDGMIGNRYSHQEARILPHGEDTVMIISRDVTREREASSRYAAVVEALPDTLVVATREGIYVDATSKGEDETWDWMIGKHVAEIYDPERAAIRMATIERALETGQVQEDEYEYEATFGDGHTYVLEARVAPLGTDRVVIITRDITERRMATARAERLARIVEGASDGILVADAGTMQVLTLNRAARINNGWSEEDIPSLTTADLTPGHTNEQIREAIQPLVLGEVERLQFEGEAKRKDGSVYPVEATFHYCDDEDPPLVVIAIIDITERRAHASELERMGRILDRSSAEVAVIDAATLHIVDTNAATRRNLGYTAEEFAQMTPLDVKPDFTAHRLAELTAPLLAGDTDVVHFETHHQRKDGSLYPVEVALEYYEDEDPPIFVAYVDDVTEQRRSIAQAERLGRIVDQSASEVLIADAATMRFIQVSQRVAENTGYSAEELAGMGVADLVHQALPEYMPDDTEPRPFGPIAVTRKDGSEYLVEGTIELDPSEDPPVFVAITQDVTERQAREEAMLQTAKLESLGQLAGGIAHDFNNLLVGVLGNASIAAEALPANSPLGPLLTEIELAGNRAADLSRELLTYAGGGQVETEVVDVNLVVREMTSLLRLVDTNVGYGLEKGLPPVQADPTQVRQVVMNLVQNAADAIVETGQPGTVHISTTATEFQRSRNSLAFPGERLARGTYVTIEVADDGPGIPIGVRQRIFDPFFTTKESGHGFGLASVLGIVRSHKGDIRVSSRPGRGATFTVYLPAAAAGVITAAGDDRPSGEAAFEGRILVVDDDMMVRSVLARALQSFGAEVDQASDGESGVEMFAANPGSYQCVFVDMSMPGIDGVETVRRIHQLGQDTKVVMMSGYAEEDAQARLPGIPVAAFLQKPFDLGRLRELTARLQQ